MSTANILENLPTDLSEEVFTDLQKSGALRIERIVSKGHTSSNWYDQEQDEWVMVMQGSATIEYDNGATFDMEAGSYLNIPAHQRHKVIRTDANIETIWLAIHYEA